MCSTYLNDGLVTFDFEDLSTTVASVGQSQVHDLSEFGELYRRREGNKTLEYSISNQENEAEVGLVAGEGSEARKFFFQFPLTIGAVWSISLDVGSEKMATQSYLNIVENDERSIDSRDGTVV